MDSKRQMTLVCPVILREFYIISAVVNCSGEVILTTNLYFLTRFADDCAIDKPVVGLYCIVQLYFSTLVSFLTTALR